MCIFYFQRLNVTLSRAKSLLILVGNAHTLCINPDFQHIINECKRHKTLVGRINNETTSEVGLDSAQNGNIRESNELTMDIANQFLKDLQYQQYSKTIGNHENAEIRRLNRLRKNNKENKNTNGDIENGNDYDSDDSKPSTSKAAGKQRAARATTKSKILKKC